MSTEHEVKAGESLLSLGGQYGLPPDSIWSDPANEQLRKKRQQPERIAPGDVVCIRDKKAKQESGNTEQRHRFRKKSSLGVVIRLDLDPNDASTHDGRFILESTDGAYHVEKTIQDDLIPGDQYVDLHYVGLRKEKSYRFKVIAEPGADPSIIFDNVTYAKLSDLSPAASGGDWEERTSPLPEDAAYPEEPDQEETST